jgi:alpha-tubulin suppressor-like RCC1 family protein
MRLKPVPVVGGLLFSQVSAGRNHTCARTPDAIAYCWGDPTNGQLGTGVFPPDPTRSNPVAGAL